MSKLPKEYFGLMRDALRQEASSPNSDKRPFKRRRRNNISANSPMVTSDSRNSSVQPSSRLTTPPTETLPGNAIEVIDVDSTTNSPTEVHEVLDVDSAEDRNIELVHEVDGREDGDDDEDDEDDNFDDFEDVDLENVQVKASSALTSDVVVSYDRSKTEEKKPKKKKNVIDKEERQFRKTFHRNHIAIMMIHGSIRNKWCNNRMIQQELLKLVTPSVYKELHPPKEVDLAQIRTRKFLDGLRHLMEIWNKYYKVTSNRGIVHHDWYDWYDTERSKVDFARFSRCLTKGRGGRDIGAQGFVALLRAAGVPSRLVYSLQPPDFTSMQIKEKVPREQGPDVEERAPVDIKDRVLELRKGNSLSTAHRPTQAEVEIKYPVFWAEAWDSASKVWITIDPMMFKIIENVRSKSQLEPPLQYPYNNLLYVIGYDRKGGVRDITRRYAEKYFAKTRKKRITKDENEEVWYSSLISALSERGRNKSDDYEDEYFDRKAEKEGMPDNIQDFKNHPFYVLEMHLKSSEILYPMEPCGTIRVKNKNETIPVFKRSCFQQLKSARGWFHKGRVLKSGERALKTKLKNPAQLKDDDDEKEERLYAEFQTELYVPPPVVDGEITKNAFGNLDVYVPSMIPEGGVLIDSEYAEAAAKAIGIDYAPAVVGFKFDRRQVTPQFGGIVVAEEYKEAVEAVQSQLEAEAIEKQRMELEIRALKGWNLFLTKLKIKQRLNKAHGKLEENDDGIGSEDELKDMEDEYNAYLERGGENDDDDDDADGDQDDHQSKLSDEAQTIDYGGGFLAEDYVRLDNDVEETDEPQERDSGGGFLLDESKDGVVRDSEGGFIPDEKGNYVDTGAGFFLEGSGSHESGADFNDNDYDEFEDKVQDSKKETELDDFEDFFNGLEGGDEDYDSDEPVIAVVEDLPIRRPVKTSLQSKAETQSSEELSVQETDAPLRSPEMNVVIPSPIRVTLPEEASIPPLEKGPSYDTELEEEFERQLEEETQETQGESSHSHDEGARADEEDNEFDFDYESD